MIWPGDEGRLIICTWAELCAPKPIHAAEITHSSDFGEPSTVVFTDGTKMKVAGGERHDFWRDVVALNRERRDAWMRACGVEP